MKIRSIASIYLLFICLSLFATSTPKINIKKLKKQCAPLEVKDNPILQNFFFLSVHQYDTKVSLGKSEVYLQTILDSFTKHNIPKPLAYLAASLSFYDNWKISNEGGSGFFQLRYIIAKQYKLKINSYIDERRDFHKALHASSLYLNDLYKEFQSWDLAVCAFYAGNVEVNKAIRKANGSRNYWDIHPFLLQSFQKTVPFLMTTIYCHLNQKELKLKPIPFSLTLTDKVPIDKWVTLYQISNALNVDYTLLKNLNPTFKKQIIPQSNKLYYINIPINSVEYFYSLGDSIYTFKPIQKTNIGIEPTPPPSGPAKVVELSEKKQTTSTKVLYYTIRSGDYLGRVADLYDVGISDLRRWNHIRGDKIRVNQRLKIYKPANKYSKYKAINHMNAAQKQRIINKD